MHAYDLFTGQRSPLRSSLPRSFDRRCVWLLALWALALGSCNNTPGGQTCRTITQCGAAEPICDATSLTCRPCDTMMSNDEVACKNRDASTPHCGQRGRCVGCVRNTDCVDPARPLCGPDNTCQGCVAADCPSKVCG